MSLARALTNLPDNAEVERALRDVLVLFRRHKAEWLSETDVRIKTGLSPVDLALILPVLARAFVLDFDSAESRYRFSGDVALGYEIETFSRRVEAHETHLRTNVARYRERYGS